MVTKELSEAATELNVILEKCSDEVLSKISVKFREFLKNIESKTYKFNYDSTKTLNEQRIKPKTRRLLALIYRDYLCTGLDKEKYISELNLFFEQENKTKYDKYSPEKLFEKAETAIKTTKSEKEEQTYNKMIKYREKSTLVKRMIEFLKKLIKYK